MKTTLTILTVFFLIVSVGCEPKDEKKELLTQSGKAPSLKQTGEKKLLTVDFQEGQTLQYRFITHKDIEVNWDPTERKPKRGRTRKERIDEYSETLKMVIAYKPLEVDPYGLTTVRADCRSVIVRRAGWKGALNDATNSLKRKSFIFTVDPSGKIEDYSKLEELIKETGKEAFRKRSTHGKIKEPDMISDFIATQWFLWDSISSIEKPAEGVSVGQSWKSKLSIPTPMITKEAREVTYTLDEIRETERGQIAVIRSSYSLAGKTPKSWPMPYSGSFQMSGTFGFLRGYKFLDLKGHGTELFNIDTGQIEKSEQQYTVKVSASFPMGISTKPLITIEQKIEMEPFEE